MTLQSASQVTARCRSKLENANWPGRVLRAQGVKFRSAHIPAKEFRGHCWGSMAHVGGKPPCLVTKSNLFPVFSAVGVGGRKKRRGSGCGCRRRGPTAAGLHLDDAGQSTTAPDGRRAVPIYHQRTQSCPASMDFVKFLVPTELWLRMNDSTGPAHTSSASLVALPGAPMDANVRVEDWGSQLDFRRLCSLIFPPEGAPTYQTSASRTPATKWGRDAFRAMYRYLAWAVNVRE